MSDELQFKYEVEIKSVEKRQTLTKEVKEELKESGMMDEKGKLKISGVSGKMLKRMKQEFVEGVLYDAEFLPLLAEKTNLENKIWEITKKRYRGKN